MDPVDPRINPALVPKGSKAVEYKDDKKRCDPVPSIRTPDGQVITRWTFSDAERMAILRGEDVYMTFFCYGVFDPVYATVGLSNWTGRKIKKSEDDGA